MKSPPGLGLSGTGDRSHDFAHPVGKEPWPGAQGTRRSDPDRVPDGLGLEEGGHRRQLGVERPVRLVGGRGRPRGPASLEERAQPLLALVTRPSLRDPPGGLGPVGPFEDKPLTPSGAVVEPITEYTHEEGCSITGGFVYRGSVVRRQAWGRYFYGDYCSGRIWSLARWNRQVTRRGHSFRVPELTSFGEDNRGGLYAVSAGGAVYRIVG